MEKIFTLSNQYAEALVMFNYDFTLSIYNPIDRLSSQITKFDFSLFKFAFFQSKLIMIILKKITFQYSDIYMNYKLESKNGKILK